MNILIIVIFILLLISLLWFKLFDIEYKCVEPHKEKHSGDYLRTAHSGVIRGIIIGILLGASPIETAIRNGAIFGITNPLVMFLGY